MSLKSKVCSLTQAAPEAASPRRESRLRLGTTARQAWLLAWLLAPGSWLLAADINKGYTFAPNEKNVTHTKLNNLVDLATINPTFITDKAAATPAGSDSFLFYSAAGAGLRRASFSQLLLSNTNLVVGQTESLTPGPGDYVLLWDALTGQLARASLNNLVFTNVLLLDGRSELTNAPPANLQFLVSSNGTYLRVGLSNLFAEWWRYEKFASNGVPLFGEHTAPTNNDRLLIWDYTAGTNKQLTLAGLMTNPPAVATLTNTDSILLFSTVTNAANPYGTNPVLSKVTLAGLFTNPPVTTAVTNGDTLLLWSTATNGPGGTNGPTMARLPLTNYIQTFVVQRFTTAESNLVADVVCNVPHGLSGTPQSVRWVLVCKTNDLGYSVGDEVNVEDPDSGGFQVFQYGANATNAWLVSRSTAFSMLNRTNGVRATANDARWRAKGYANYYP